MGFASAVVEVAYTYDDDNNSVDSAVLPNYMLDCNYANTMDNFVQFDSHTHRHLFDCLVIPCVEFPAMIYATMLINQI